ncbi:MAG: hypothetical protein DMG04_02550 [Acidobacteria bacterium]|nr:MAG: hypothetical protein DMG04_02550 [Acidobacteriota bacterium]
MAGADVDACQRANASAIAPAASASSRSQRREEGEEHGGRHDRPGNSSHELHCTRKHPRTAAVYNSYKTIAQR